MSTEKEKHLAELAATASAADRDTEEELDELFEMVVQRREDPTLKARYEGKRDELVALLREHGPRYFIDSNGDKRYAYVVAPESVEVDMDELIALYESGEISQEVINQVAPRKVDKEELRKAVSRGDITAEQFVKFASLVPKTAYVGFSDPIL